MDTKKLRGTLIGDYEVSGAVDNVWIDTSNPNKVLTKVFIKDKWKSIADSASTEEAIAFAEQGLAGKTDKVTDAVDGNLAALDASGNLTDSGKNISDFLSAAANTGTDGQILQYVSGVPQWATAPQGTVVVDSAMSDSSTNAIQNSVVKAYVDLKADKTALDNYALKTGSYDTLTAGMAKNIEGQSTSTGTFLERTTANALDVANGAASVKSVKGHSVVWNQLIDNKTSALYYNNLLVHITVEGNTFNILFDNASQLVYTKEKTISGHKYFVNINVKSISASIMYYIDGSVVNSMSSPTNVKRIITGAAGNYAMAIVSNTSNLTVAVEFQLIDLTRIFDAGNEPTTVEQFEAWLEQNVGLKPYYAYDAGSILNNKLTGFKTIGRNLLNPTTKTARLISYEYGDNDNKFCIKNLPTGATLSFAPDATGVAASVTPDSNGIFTISGTGTLTVTTDSSVADTYVCFVWDGTMNNETVAYEDHTYDFDVTKIYGQLDGAGDYVQVFPNGMLSAVSVKDVLTKDSAVVNVGRVDLGTLGWNQNGTSTTGGCYYTLEYPSIQGGTPNTSIIVYKKYLPNTYAYRSGTPLGNYICIGDNGKIYISDLDISSNNELQTSLSGSYANFIITPKVYTNLIYRDNGVDTPLSEIFPINMLVDNWSTEQALVTAYSSGAPTSCAPVVETLYGLDVAEMLDSYEHGEFPSKASIDNLASTLAALIGYTYDPTKKVWDDGHWNFGATGCFTANSNFLAAGTGASGTWSIDETTKALTLTPDEE